MPTIDKESLDTERERTRGAEREVRKRVKAKAVTMFTILGLN